MIPFDRLVRNSDYGSLGALKITTQKYYRVNGGSTQLKGVNSDVVVPDRYSYLEIGEREQEHPMPWDKIASAEFEPWIGYMDLEKTIERSKKRMKDNDYLKLIEENAKWIKDQQDRSSSSLSFESYKKMIEDADGKAAYFESINDFDSKLTFESLQYEDELFVKDETLREKRNRWHESLAKDIYIDEALNVLKDLKFKFTNPKKMIGGLKHRD
jgi:carboxyl-terminal processing protease